jgi:hypothetical protein
MSKTSINLTPRTKTIISHSLLNKYVKCVKEGILVAECVHSDVLDKTYWYMTDSLNQRTNQLYSAINNTIFVKALKEIKDD